MRRCVAPFPASSSHPTPSETLAMTTSTTFVAPASTACKSAFTPAASTVSARAPPSVAVVAVKAPAGAAPPVQMVAATPPPSVAHAGRAIAPSARAYAQRGPVTAPVIEKEVNEGDPYLRETMKQYVPPLLTSAFIYGCVALSHVSAAIATVMPPM